MIAVGQQVGNYRVLRKLAEGGMGVVFVAQHLQIERRAAIKVLHPEYSQSPEFSNRFLNEARAVNLVRHPGLIEIYEFGVLPDAGTFIVMEYLEGETLAERRRRSGRLPERDALFVAWHIAQALQAAHEKDIVHRDLKPENVMLVPDAQRPGQERIKIFDFGIAKLAANQHSRGPAHLRTRTGALMGTPLYMSPEQCQAMAVSDRSDVYSLGVLLYEVLAGRPPFESEMAFDLMGAHVRTQPPPLREVQPAISAKAAALVHTMLRKDPTQRPTMAEVVQRLEQLVPDLASHQMARPAAESATSSGGARLGWARTLQAMGATAASRLSFRRHRRSYGLALLLLIAVAAGWLLLFPKAPAPRNPEADAARLLRQVDQDLSAQRWESALRQSEALLQAEGMSVATKELAATRREQALREQQAQKDYERFLSAAQRGELDGAVAIYRALPAETQYRQLGKRRYAELHTRFLTSHLKQAEAFLRESKCPQFAGEVQLLLETDITNPEVGTLSQQPCPPLKLRPPRLAAPVRSDKGHPLDEATTDRIIEDAKTAYARGDLRQAIELARSVHALRAWRIVGASACELYEPKLIKEAYDKLDPDGKQYVLEICHKNGVGQRGSNFVRN